MAVPRISSNRMMIISTKCQSPRHGLPGGFRSLEKNTDKDYAREKGKVIERWRTITPPKSGVRKSDYYFKKPHAIIVILLEREKQ